MNSKQNIIIKKESIQLQVPLQLPCYDFTTIINNTVKISLNVEHKEGSFLFLLNLSVKTKERCIFLSTIHFQSVTGGVYKA